MIKAVSHVTPDSKDLFGSIQTGYAVVESDRLDDWRRFGEDALGMHVAEKTDSVLAFRLDKHARRLIVQRGPSEDLTIMGLEISDETALRTILSRLAARQIPVERGDPAAAKLRGVEQFWSFIGPKQQVIELYTTPILSDEPLKMKTSGFVTGDAGMGHFAITSRRPEEMLQFWQQLFNARISDHIEAHISGLTLDITFLRLNPRHHSLAVAATRGRRMDPIRTRIQHMNVQAATLDDMSAAYQRCRKLGYAIDMGVGQHTNDRELSFYVRTPTGFDIEFGWNPIEVEEAGWQPVVHQGISIWGHKPQDQTLSDKLGELGRSVRSLMSTEFMPTAFEGAQRG